MILTFLGATHEVTGSCSLLQACGKNILIDYGMEQGRDVYANEKIPVAAAEIDYVVVTHAHIDHSGLLPLLYKEGFRGEIHGTIATCNLCGIMLRDSAHIQEFEAEWRNRKGRRTGKEPFIPLYTMEDAVGAAELLHTHFYDEEFTLSPGIEVRFVDAGHLLGSSSPVFRLTEGTETRTLVFSGDIGNIHQPLLRDPQLIDTADYAVIESTYGDRLHDAPPDYAAAFAKVLQQTFDRGGSVVIPSFAVGRTQELLYFLRHIKEQKLVSGHDGFRVYVDSPLAIEATTIFANNAECCFDEEAKALVDSGVNPLQFDGLSIAVSADESRAINTDATPKVIISASGMCEAGRIKHHLKHNLWDSNNTILFVGYQAGNTLGRSLLDGAKRVKLFGEEIMVGAEILQLPGISGHGDMHELLRWIGHLDPAPRTVFVNHGESDVCDRFAQRLRDELGLQVEAPYSGARFDLIRNECLFRAEPQPLAVAAEVQAARAAEEKKQAAAAAEALVEAASRLYRLTKGVRNGSVTTQDPAALLAEIEALTGRLEK